LRLLRRRLLGLRRLRRLRRLRLFGGRWCGFRSFFLLVH
jgi:hypothetical protein